MAQYGEGARRPPNSYETLGQTTHFSCPYNCMCRFTSDKNRTTFDNMFKKEYLVTHKTPNLPSLPPMKGPWAWSSKK